MDSFAKSAIIGFTGLTGGGTGALDAIECEDILGDDTDRAIATGDMAIGVNSSGEFYVYRYNAAGTASENSPLIIVPDDRAADCSGNGQWELVDVIGKGFTASKVSGVAGTSLLYEANSTDINGVGWKGPASRDSDLYLAFSNADPAINQFLLFPAPTTGTSTGVWTTYGQFGALPIVTTSTITAGSGPTVITDATGKLLVAALDTDMATQAELNAVAALVDTDDEIIAIINASPSTQLSVAAGGTGAASLTDGGILLGSGTGAITALGAATNGQIPIGDGTTDPVLNEIDGTANEITVTNGAGTITLSLPTGIAATKIGDGSVTTVEFQYLNDVTSAIQAQFTAKAPLDSPIFTDDISIGAAGVKLAGSDGDITLTGLGDGDDQTLTINLDDTVGSVVVTSSEAAISFSALNLVTTGTLSGAMPIATDADAHTITAAEAYGYLLVSTGAGAWDMPAAVPGMSFCLLCTTAAAVTLNPDNADVLVYDGVADTAGHQIAGGAVAGDFICFIAIDATYWHSMGRRGTWTPGS